MSNEKTGEFAHSVTVSRTVKINLGNYQSTDIFESATTKFDKASEAEQKHELLSKQVDARLRRRIEELGKDPAEYL